MQPPGGTLAEEGASHPPHGPHAALLCPQDIQAPPVATQIQVRAQQVRPAVMLRPQRRGRHRQNDSGVLGIIICANADLWTKCS